MSVFVQIILLSVIICLTLIAIRFSMEEWQTREEQFEIPEAHQILFVGPVSVFGSLLSLTFFNQALVFGLASFISSGSLFLGVVITLYRAYNHHVKYRYGTVKTPVYHFLVAKYSGSEMIEMGIFSMYNILMVLLLPWLIGEASSELVLLSSTVLMMIMVANLFVIIGISLNQVRLLGNKPKNKR